MPAKWAERWELVFSSGANGQSFNTLMGRVSGLGPFLLLLRDAGGAVFGGFSSQPLSRNGNFYGEATTPLPHKRLQGPFTACCGILIAFLSSVARAAGMAGDFQCFVFSLLPAAVIYRPAGVNTNFVWCGHNFKQLPNGVGFGGQVGPVSFSTLFLKLKHMSFMPRGASAPSGALWECMWVPSTLTEPLDGGCGQVNYFGILLDGSCESGMSRPSATYNSPSLSSEQVFTVGGGGRAIACVPCGAPHGGEAKKNLTCGLLPLVIAMREVDVRQCSPF
jgi:TLD